MRTCSKKNDKRLVALAFLLCFLMVALLSQAYILTNARHWHTHHGHAHTEHSHYSANEQCVVCAQIHSIEHLLKQFGAAVVCLPTGLLGLFAAIALLCGVSAFRFLSPVNQKTRLNN